MKIPESEDVGLRVQAAIKFIFCEIFIGHISILKLLYLSFPNITSNKIKILVICW